MVTPYFVIHRGVECLPTKVNSCSSIFSALEQVPEVVRDTFYTLMGVSAPVIFLATALS